MNGLSIVIPVLNEGKNIAKLVGEIIKVKKKISLKNFELIIIDDNSIDNTKIVLKKIIKKNKFLKYYIRKNTKRDLSKSCLLGFQKSVYPNILVMDGDLQHPPEYIPHMIKKYEEGYDVVQMIKKNQGKRCG